MKNTKTQNQQPPAVSVLSLRLRALFALALIVGIILNFAQFSKKLSRLSTIKNISPMMYEGIKFAGLEEFLKREDTVGYYTDKDLDNTAHARQFTLAQYSLAPIVLDLNNTGLKFVIFDCLNEESARNKMKELGLTPYKKNPYGIYLAINPHVSSKP